MFAKSLLQCAAKTQQPKIFAGKSLTSLTSRGVYAAGNEPHVFINKHTKVIVQGMTGKHVSKHTNTEDSATQNRHNTLQIGKQILRHIGTQINYETSK